MTSLQLFQKGTDYLLGLDIERTILGHVTQIYLLVLAAAFYSFAISCQHTIVASTSIFSMQGFFTGPAGTLQNIFIRPRKPRFPTYQEDHGHVGKPTGMLHIIDAQEAAECGTRLNIHTLLKHTTAMLLYAASSQCLRIMQPLAQQFMQSCVDQHDIKSQCTGIFA